jgi:phosphotransferase system  glucose/maltose/N-acetylglucosamine-specific IIC component
VTWLAWRQQRTEMLVAALVLGLLAALLVPTGLHMDSVYAHDHLAACVTQPKGSW